MCLPTAATATCAFAQVDVAQFKCAETVSVLAVHSTMHIPPYASHLCKTPIKLIPLQTLSTPS